MFSPIGRRNAAIFGACAVWLSAASAAWAQANLAANAGDGKPAKSATAHKDPVPGTGGESAAPQPASGAPMQPAKVSLRNGMLTVEASNSDLTQILKNLADMSGMIVEGLGKGPAVFGVYGPGNPREVLTELLVGSGYNFIMIGSCSSGAPRKLVLTPFNSDASNLAQSSPPPVSSGHDDAEQPQQDAPYPEQLGPGAVYPVPPPRPQDENIRTQQNLQRLQHIQERQQQQQQQPSQ